MRRMVAPDALVMMPHERMVLMNGLPLHPVVVHLPLVIALLVPALAAGLTWASFRGRAGRRAWAIALALQAIVTGTALLAMRSGEGAEEAAEAVAPESALHAHEEAAEVFFFGTIAVLVGLGATVALKPRWSRWAGLAVTGGALAVALLGERVGHAGGTLVYQHGAGVTVTEPGPAGALGLETPPRRHEHDDD